MAKKTFEEVACAWKTEKRLYIKKTSYAAYVHLLNKHLLPWFSAQSSLDEKTVQEYVNGKLKEGLGEKTVKDSLIVLKMILRFGWKNGALPQFDYKVIFPTTAEKYRCLPVLQLQDQKKLCFYLLNNPTPRNLGILICMQSGLRIGEVCGLMWQDIDLSAGEIHVRRTVSRIWLSDGDEKQNELHIGTPKTLSSVRDIPLSRNLAAIVRLLKKKKSPTSYVLSDAEIPLEPRYYRDYFRNLLCRLGIPPIRFHALRHTFATRCIESGCDYKTVSVILGHSSLATTMDLYVHPGFAEKKKAIEKMARALG